MWKLYECKFPKEITDFLNSLNPDVAKTAKILVMYASPTHFYIWYKE